MKTTIFNEAVSSLFRPFVIFAMIFTVFVVIYMEKCKKDSDVKNLLMQESICIDGYKFVSTKNGPTQIIDAIGNGIKCR